MSGIGKVTESRGPPSTLTDAIWKFAIQTLTRLRDQTAGATIGLQSHQVRTRLLFMQVEDYLRWAESSPCHVVAYRTGGSVGIGGARRTAQLIADKFSIPRFWQVCSGFRVCFPSGRIPTLGGCSQTCRCERARQDPTGRIPTLGSCSWTCGWEWARQDV